MTSVFHNKGILTFKLKSFIKKCTEYISYLIIILLLTTKANAQGFQIKPFAPRTSTLVPNEFKGKTSYNLRGDFIMIGNSNIFSNLPGVPADIYNSSMAEFQLPQSVPLACTKIVYAGLYWFGKTEEDNGVTSDKKKSIKFKTPAMTNYIDLTAKSTDIYFGERKTDIPSNPFINEYMTMFAGYYDVTELVRTAGVGEYSVGNIYNQLGLYEPYRNNISAGWGMVIIYENQSLKPRNITVFDGFNYIKPANNGPMPNTESGTLEINGFRTSDYNPQGKFGMMATRINPSETGDSFQFKGGNDQYVSLSHPEMRGDFYFDSSIYIGDNNRIPYDRTNFGTNIGVVDFVNQNRSLVSGNQTQMALRYNLSGGTFGIYNIVTAVDAIVPKIAPLLLPLGGFSNNGTVEPNQILEFEVPIRNKGNEGVTGTKLEITLPPNVYFVSGASTPASIPANWSSTAGTNPAITLGGKITCNIGNILFRDDLERVIYKLKFKVKVANDCILQTSTCAKNITISGKVTATGDQSNNNASWDLITAYMANECASMPINNVFSLNINPANCADITTDGFKTFTICDATTIARTNITAIYPTETKFYSQLPNTDGYEATLINGDFPVANGITKYYAIANGMPADCYFKLQTQLGSCGKSNMMTNPMIPIKFKTQ
ncbi:DUF11 domain-containing protein [Pedobacter nototheniae]|uniref:DUF11 domain-containing protein n=1 Tax=Pedobacter nototheniae TaxID=2488994 RepID=UPI00103C3387|nr:DUF11 domain-containing protein [Pedobacter nototheniae]